MRLAETPLAEELDRLIYSAVVRIEQQGIHIAESSASPSQVAGAENVLADMVEGLQRLRLRRAQLHSRPGSDQQRRSDAVLSFAN